jgi:carbon-monoxide dehydrogenase large subunit
VVEVDTETGGVRLRDYAAVDDCGTVLLPGVVAGQQHGGSVAGIGQALTEEFVYDTLGNPLTATFVDYRLLSAAELPSIRTATMDIATPNSINGAKGIGENGAIVGPAAVHNAIVDALAPRGVTDIVLPATPQRVWEAMAAVR